MLYREAGQFKTTYAADQQLFPIRQDRIGMAILLAAAFVGVPLVSVVPAAAAAIVGHERRGRPRRASSSSAGGESGPGATSWVAGCVAR